MSSTQRDPVLTDEEDYFILYDGNNAKEGVTMVLYNASLTVILYFMIVVYSTYMSIIMVFSVFGRF